MEDLSKAKISYIHVSAITARAKKVRELRNNHPKFFNSNFLKVNVASRLLIEAGGEWATAQLAENPKA